MNLGSENRKKTIAATVLGVLALAMVVYRIANPAGAPPPPAAMDPQASSPPPTTPQATVRRTSTSASKATGTKKARVAPVSLDPTLQLGLLRASEDTKYTGAGRNIFQAEVDIPKPVVSPVVTKTEPEPPPPPPPPPPLPLKFFGFASKPGEPKRIFLSKGEDVFIAGEGEIVDRRYKVLHIGPTSVEIEDVLNNNRQSIPLTQG
ncbi:MAG TPA: hypothetical protein VJX16_21960 [Terriglobales bacterium]|nr:hypothetical protein [Terriglobales bacterium]